jgi:hypothetical protein
MPRGATRYPDGLSLLDTLADKRGPRELAQLTKSVMFRNTFSTFV